MTIDEPINWGPQGELVYNRTYSRPKPDGTKETWPETVERVVDGNLGLVDERYHAPYERDELVEMIRDFKILPAGRHLWASGVKGRQYLFNCHVSHWNETLSDHFEFTFMRLMEGGGVGANYSNSYLSQYPEVQQTLSVEIVCDPSHPDYDELEQAGVLSKRYNSDWVGAYEVEDSREGWSGSLVELVDTFYRDVVEHTYRVFDVSRVRGRGTRLKTFGGTASGPLPLAKMLMDVADVLNDFTGQKLTGLGAMEIDHHLAECVVSGGNRRSARMAMMRWDDPQIFEFIHCKAQSGKHWTTNISVEVDQRFWNNADDDEDTDMGVHAKKVLAEISKGALNNGEPGTWNSDLSNDGEVERAVCTNPCGEIALTPWENCNLGHVNLAAFVDETGHVDTIGLYRAHRLVARFLIRATFGDVNDPKQQDQLARQRRIGVGHLGVASHLALRGIRYSDAPANEDFREELRIYRFLVQSEARDYAHQLRIPTPIKTTTVAPTGTIAKMPGVSEGIHPIFSRYFIRRIRFSVVDPEQAATLATYRMMGYSVEPCEYAANTDVVAIPTKDSLVADVAAIYGEEKAEEIVQSADELTLEEMLAFQALYQVSYADNAVSFTANLDPTKYTIEQVGEILQDFAPLLKGTTIFPDASMPQAPYERLTREQYEAAVAKEIGDGVDENCANGACPIK
ncbi:ribonucleotide reductase [Rhodococcus phage BobbyDazzler]|uniref:ribonucleoside-triphosphate reductase (thioredoxin) n=1 Tax=Rhodococcus phage Hiro TaxID=2015828 RepID=A0A222ZIJ4_9CAUD|nr:ribonucleotide reductase [Rhodococcus phage Hiro]AQP30968.1 ribonucleotide reductase [Rhodococcus phage BobbyDazzler]ASR80819.1 ribonucleotide reductase [Rhodococcus phage Yoncess]ASR84225.1 ribonucleotide reductase [Rhodococcus phage Hiro]